MKTKEEILDQLYISADDLKILIPAMSYAKALKYIKEKQQQMKEKKLFVPSGKTKLALTKIVKKDCGF